MAETRAVSRWIVFVNSRFNGFYRYRNEFQVYPLDPSLKGAVNPHIPCALSFPMIHKGLYLMNVSLNESGGRKEEGRILIINYSIQQNS